ncbi:hypothetical protein ABMC88_18410, partial [Sulfitobacter sp. HNIBRBA2951]|uniref:hypothetical protein n=1 Tax=Sulfitobacter aquimarinus TaxID=3158557 RepID=UPI0032DEFC08
MKKIITSAVFSLALPTASFANTCKQYFDLSTPFTQIATSVESACLEGLTPLGGDVEITDTKQWLLYNQYNGKANGLGFECTYEGTNSNGNFTRVEEGRAKYVTSPTSPLTTGLVTYQNDDCQAVCPASQGNPIDALTSLKSEKAIDWQSPKDNRFRIERMYSSAATIHNGANTGWADGWYSTITSAYEGYAQFDRALERPGGKVVHLRYANGTFSPKRKSSGLRTTTTVRLFPHRPGEHTVHLGDGRTEVYTEYSQYDAELSELGWADGYRQFLSYDSSGKLIQLDDNRGQVARFTWQSVSVGARTKDVITDVEIDISGGDILFSPDILVEYAISGRESDERVLHDTVTVTEVATGASLQEYSYEYLESDFGPYDTPPKLTSVADGRTASSGDPVIYAEFQYDPDTGLAINTQHSGGVDEFEVIKQTDNTTLVTNPLGRRTIYQTQSIEGVPHMTSVVGEEINTCLGTAQNYSYFNPVTGQDEHYVFEQTERNGSVTRF